jgi:hypothetical protein
VEAGGLPRGNPRACLKNKRAGGLAKVVECVIARTRPWFNPQYWGKGGIRLICTLSPSSPNWDHGGQCMKTRFSHVSSLMTLSVVTSKEYRYSSILWLAQAAVLVPGITGPWQCEEFGLFIQIYHDLVCMPPSHHFPEG